MWGFTLSDSSCSLAWTSSFFVHVYPLSLVIIMNMHLTRCSQPSSSLSSSFISNKLRNSFIMTSICDSFSDLISINMMRTLSVSVDVNETWLGVTAVAVVVVVVGHAVVIAVMMNNAPVINMEITAGVGVATVDVGLEQTYSHLLVTHIFKIKNWETKSADFFSIFFMKTVQIVYQNRYIRCVCMIEVFDNEEWLRLLGYIF